MEIVKSFASDTVNHTCDIDMKLPSLNDYVDLCRRNRYQSASYKKRIEKQIMMFTRGLKKCDHAVIIHFTWIEKDKRRDCDNIAFAKKFILDALVKSGKLKNDSMKYVKGFSDTFMYGDRTHVLITIEEIENEPV